MAALELNVSCPNVETGLVMGADPAETAAAVERVRPLCDQPLIVKLTPNAAETATLMSGVVIDLDQIKRRGALDDTKQPLVASARRGSA